MTVTWFTCHHPRSARLADGWVESCGECRETRRTRVFGEPVDEWWRPVTRAQTIEDGHMVLRDRRGLPYAIRPL